MAKENQESLRQLTDLQKKHREQLEANKQKIQLRKQRTHRLIVRGAMTEALIPDAENLTDEEFKERLYSLMNSDS